MSRRLMRLVAHLDAVRAFGLCVVGLPALGGAGCARDRFMRAAARVGFRVHGAPSVVSPDSAARFFSSVRVGVWGALGSKWTLSGAWAGESGSRRLVLVKCAGRAAGDGDGRRHWSHNVVVEAVD